MKSNPLRLVTRLGLTASLPVVLLGLWSVGGYADTTDDPSPAPSPTEAPPPAPSPGGPVIEPQGTVAWEKSKCKQKNPLVTLSRPVDVPVTVLVDTADGTAVAPGDYLPIRALKVTVPAGSLSAEIPVTIVADDIVEPDEYFTVRISSPSAGQIGKDTAVVTIKDGEQPLPCEKK